MYSSVSDEHLANFAHNVAALRQKHGLTKKAMADILRISPRTLNTLEKGQMPPRLDVEVLFRLGSYFRISIIDLLQQRM